MTWEWRAENIRKINCTPYIPSVWQDNRDAGVERRR